jgi:Ca2+:H+ antiporter
MTKDTGRKRHLIAYMLPPACLLLAMFIRLGGTLIEHAGHGAMAVAAVLSIVMVFSTVFVVLHHAESIAHRLGEPYGTLVLTFAVTTIEVSIIVSMMLHGPDNPTLARESVFSTVMIVCCGVVGICLTLGGWRHRSQDIKRQGTSAFLAVLIALTVLTMVLPNYTLAAVPGRFSTAQLAFVGVLSVFLYGAFVFAQSISQKQDFLDDEREEAAIHHGSAPLAISFVLLFAGLIGIVLLTEEVAAGVEDTLLGLGVTQADSIVGALIALIVLLPEALSAVRAALANQLQRGLNIALGSACATIGLTIPAVSVASLVTGRELTLGLGAGDTVLLVLALAISLVSFGTGRTTALTGLTHLVVFLAYILLIVVP